MVLAVAGALLAACGDTGSGPEPPEGRARLTVRSNAFDPGQPLPTRFSCDGAGVSPPLSWRGPAGKAVAYALVVDDPDAPAGTYVHWVVADLPRSVTSLPADAGPEPGRQPATSAGERGYTPPCPPSGTHHYRFTVYALEHRLGLDPGTEPERAVEAITGAAVAWGRLTATYRHRG